MFSPPQGHDGYAYVFLVEVRREAVLLLPSLPHFLLLPLGPKGLLLCTSFFSLCWILLPFARSSKSSLGSSPALTFVHARGFEQQKFRAMMEEGTWKASGMIQSSSKVG